MIIILTDYADSPTDPCFPHGTHNVNLTLPCWTSTFPCFNSSLPCSMLLTTGPSTVVPPCWKQSVESVLSSLLIIQSDRSIFTPLCLSVPTLAQETDSTNSCLSMSEEHGFPAPKIQFWLSSPFFQVYWFLNVSGIVQTIKLYLQHFCSRHHDFSIRDGQVSKSWIFALTLLIVFENEELVAETGGYPCFGSLSCY